MSDWREVKLKEVCKNVTVGYVGPMAHRYEQNGIPFLRSLNIKPYRLDFDDLKFIGQDFHHQIKKSSLHPNDVVVVRTGNPGTACVIPDILGEANCSDLVIIRPGNQLNPYFLACIFNSLFGQRLVLGNLVGVAQQHFNITVAKEIKIKLPPKKLQDKIAAILSAYDDLIENNTQRIALLEKAAEEIYREWFVRMRFPGWEQTKFVKGVPEGWELIKLGEICKIKGGKRLPEGHLLTDEITIHPYIKGRDIKSGKINTVNLQYVEEKTFDKIRNYTVNAGDICITIVANIGDVGIVPTYLDHANLTENAVKLVNAYNRYEPVFLLYTLATTYYKEFMETLSAGAAQSKLGIYKIQSIKVFLPPMRLQELFGEQVIPIRQETETLERANEFLRKSRDLLLPRLISGKLAVDDLDIHFPPRMIEPE